MVGEKFTLMQYSISAILGFIDADEFVIPEIQRPFVWKRSQVRDLIDSLYNDDTDKSNFTVTHCL